MRLLTVCQTDSFQLQSVLKGVPDLFSQLVIGAIDGIKDDGSQFGHVHLIVRCEHALINADVDDLPHQAAASTPWSNGR